MSASHSSLPLGGKKTLPTTQLIHGDCLEVVPTMPASSVEMVFADLPYRSTGRHWDKYVSFEMFWPSVWQVASKDAVVCCTATQPFATDLICSQRAYFKYDLIWHKSCVSGIFHAKKQPMRAHEHALIFCRGKAKYAPQMTDVGPDNAYRPKTIYASKNINTAGKVALSQIHRPDTGKRYPLSVQKIASEARRNCLHPTQKPVALLEWLIRTYTNEGDTVLDPVFGSATTAIACLRTGRNFIGIEKDADYYEIGRKRVDEERRRLEVDLTT